MKYICIRLVKLYRKFISPLKPSCCRFTPTCSAYALEAFQKRGFFCGLILTVWRILPAIHFAAVDTTPYPTKALPTTQNNRAMKMNEKGCSETEQGYNEFTFRHYQYTVCVYYAFL